MRIRAKKICKGSLFKVIFIGFSVSLLPFILICGVASVFGAETVTVGSKQVTGIMGLVAAMLMYPVFCFVFSAMIWICFAFGLWVYSLFRKVELEFADCEIVGSNVSS